MQATRLRDREVELLLNRSTMASDDFADLEAFVSALSSDLEPPRDVSHMGTSLAAVARAASRPRSRGLKRLATVGIVGAILMAMSGIAFAANRAVPGQTLYGVDRALEAIGIGNGGVEERLAEFDFLVMNGSDEEAFVFLAEFIDSADPRDGLRAQNHLELAVAKSNPNAQAAQVKVAALKDFIEANKGKGVGVDGKDFGQGVSGIARSENAPEPAQATDPAVEEKETGSPEHAGPKDDKEPGPPEHAGPKDDKETGPPEHAGPKETGDSTGSDDAGTLHAASPDQPPTQETSAKGEPKETGPPDHAGPKDDQETGPPDHAGPKDDRETGPPDHAGTKDK